MIRAAIVEDDELFRSQMKEFIKRYESEHSVNIEPKVYTDGTEIAGSYHGGFDVIFMDIEMPQLDGMSAAGLIRERDREVIIIFITNVAKYAVSGYAVGAYDYILKPLKYEAFESKMNMVARLVREKKQSRSILVKSRADVYRLRSDEILYVEVLQHNVIYHTEKGEYSVRGSLNEALSQLEGLPFSRCNKSYIVNLAFVRGVKDETVVVGNEKLPLSRLRRKEFMDTLAAYVSGSMGGSGDYGESEE